MTSEQETETMMRNALLQWCERNDSLIVETPSRRFYALFFEPDREGPRMQYIGTTLARAYNFVKTKHTNLYISGE